MQYFALAWGENAGATSLYAIAGFICQHPHQRAEHVGQQDFQIQFQALIKRDTHARKTCIPFNLAVDPAHPMVGHIFKFELGQACMPAGGGLVWQGRNHAWAIAVLPFLGELGKKAITGMADALEVFVPEIAAGGKNFVEQLAALIRHATQQDFMGDQRLQRAMHPAEEVMTLANAG